MMSVEEEAFFVLLHYRQGNIYKTHIIRVYKKHLSIKKTQEETMENREKNLTFAEK